MYIFLLSLEISHLCFFPIKLWEDLVNLKR